MERCSVRYVCSVCMFSNFLSIIICSHHLCTNNTYIVSYEQVKNICNKSKLDDNSKVCEESGWSKNNSVKSIILNYDVM